MYSELECGVCYRTFNAGRRCPRELQCKHSFCESCLRALSRPLGPDRSIVCPLCRHATFIPQDRTVRAELRVDECLLERLLAAGMPDEEGDEPEEREGGGGGDEGVTLPEAPGEGSESRPVSRGGRLRRSLSKVWKKISGNGSRQRGGEGGFPRTDDMCLKKNILRIQFGDCHIGFYLKTNFNGDRTRIEINPSLILVTVSALVQID